MQAVILAAGESSRFWPLNQKHKSLFKIMGRPLIWHTIEGLKKTAVKEIIIAQGLKKDIENDLKIYKFKDLKIRYVQAEPKGTGECVLRAKNLLKGPFVVVGGHKVDVNEYLPQLFKTFKTNPKKAILSGTKTDRPEDFGMVRFKGQKVLEIVEKPKKNEEPSDIKTSETYVLPADFVDYLEKVPRAETNLISAINLLIKERGAEIVLTKKPPISLKYPWDLFSILEYLFSGAKGKIYIGKNCEISQNCSLRGPVSIGDNCRIGNSVEIKNSIIGDNSKIPHLSYVGDSIIGENCNLGAGTITANLRFDKKTIKAKVKENLLDTGREKFGSVLGNNTQTGINVSLMPGILIGENCTVYPGSVVAENIEDNTKFFTKFETVKKSG